MLLPKHPVIWLLLIGLFATLPLLLRADDECRRALPSYSVRYAAIFYELASRFFTQTIGHQVFSNTSIIFGELLSKEADRKAERVRGMTRNADEANRWEIIMLQQVALQCVFFLASQAITYHEAYKTIRAENNLQTQIADAQLMDESILEVMRNIRNYFRAPIVRNEIFKYELLAIAELPLVAIVINASEQRPKLLVDLKYPCSKFLDEPELMELPHLAGFFRTPIECRLDLNVCNDYTILLRALNVLDREFKALANRSQSLKYSDYFLATVPPKALNYAQTFIQKSFADSPLTAVVEYQLIVTTFLRLLLDFLLREYNWQRCHPVRYLNNALLTDLWTQISLLANNNSNSYKNAYNTYIKSRNLQDEMDALYKSLKKYNIRVGFTLRADIGVAIADNAVKKN